MHVRIEFGDGERKEAEIVKDYLGVLQSVTPDGRLFTVELAYYPKEEFDGTMESFKKLYPDGFTG